MKNKIVCILSALILLICSCKKELYQNPTTSKDLSKFLSTQTESEEYINAVYATLQSTGLYGQYLPCLSEIPSDNTYDQVPSNDNGNFGQLDQFTTIASNDIIETTWRDSYQGIQKANVVLNRIDAIAYSDSVLKKARKGEILFIRSLLYFNLVRLYGNVPLVTTQTTDPNLYFGQGRQPVTKIYDQIKTDLISAIAVLPDNPAQPGRVIKTAAEALLGKVYLTLQDYTNARIQLLAVVNSGRHLLLPRVRDVFSVANENNKEIIFSVQFASGINGNSEGSPLFQICSPSGTISGAKGHNLPTLSLYNIYSLNDLRKDVYVTLAKTGAPFNNKLSPPTGTVLADGPTDYVVLRYADVILMLAEIENESGNSLTASNYLNLIRSRAGLPNSVAASSTDLRAAIATERRLELIGEGNRWFDLLRTGTAVAVMNKWFADNNILISIDSHNLLMPVPQTQINTDPSIVQNPGY